MSNKDITKEMNNLYHIYISYILLSKDAISVVYMYIYMGCKAIGTCDAASLSHPIPTTLHVFVLRRLATGRMPVRWRVAEPGSEAWAFLSLEVVLIELDSAMEF